MFIFLRQKWNEFSAGIIVKEKFLKKFSKKEELWADLIQQRYINRDGVIQNKFRELRSAKELNIDIKLDEEKKQRVKQKVFNALQYPLVVREWTEAIATAVILALFINTFFVKAFKIPSGSMIPTLLIGDRLMVSKCSYGPRVPFSKKHRLPGFTKPERGDVIVFIYPEDPKKHFIKRLIAFGGEEVQIKWGDVYIDGELIEDEEIKKIKYYNRGQYAQLNQFVKVPDGHVFVLGDNSKSSHDSRYWGFVPEENIVGRAEIIYWPFTRMRWIK